MPGLDAAFLALESETTHLHVVGALLLDPVDAPADQVFRRIRTRIVERLAEVPPLRMRAVPAPLGLAHPRMVEEPDLDLGYHVRRAGLPSPGGRRELEALLADIASRPLDRRRPLWEIHVVDGLDGGGLAVVAKLHHAVADGVAGAELLATFLDLEPEATASPVTRIEAGRRHPARTAARPSSSAVESGATQDPGPGLGAPTRDDGAGRDVPAAAAALAPDPEPWRSLLASVPGQVEAIVRTVGRAAGRLRAAALEASRAEPRPPLPFSAPTTSINRSISPHRRVALADLAMEDVSRVRDVLGGTLNDVVLASAAGGLRRFFAARREDPGGPLVAMVPVSLRPTAERGALGNRLSAWLVRLPVDRADAVERLAAVRASVETAKSLDEHERSRLLDGLAQAAVPAVTSSLSEAASRGRVFDRLRPIFNLVVSNVPGPGATLYLAGIPLRAIYPLGPVIEGAAVNITVVSYRNRVHVGVNACWDVVADVELIARGLEDSLAELVRAADRRDRPVPWWHAEVLPA